MAPVAADVLPLFELPAAWVRPALTASRGFNTVLDTAFYDVPTLAQDLRAKGEAIETARPNAPPDALDLDALANPEGALLVVDPTTAPYVTRHDDLSDFIAWHKADPRQPSIVSITGVGSSALGSAALAWDVALARKAPVIAIVPGYGLADALWQALGGWFGFGLHEALGTRTHVQNWLALYAPEVAGVGHKLLDDVPGSHSAVTGAPVFQRGSGSSDVLHHLMREIRVTCLVGHSKGALSIANALDGLDAALTEGLEVITLGCPVEPEAPGAHYRQYLGAFDALGQLNAWGNQPTDWTPTVHTTNRGLPLSMDAVALTAP